MIETQATDSAYLSVSFLEKEWRRGLSRSLDVTLIERQFPDMIPCDVDGKEQEKFNDSLPLKTNCNTAEKERTTEL